MTENLQSLEDKHSALIAVRNRLEGEVSQLVDSAQGLEQALNIETAAHNRLSEEKLTLVRQLAELTALIGMLESDLDETIGERDRALATRQQLATEKAELSTQHTTLTTEKRSRVRQLAELATLKKALETQYDTLVGEKTEIEKEKAVLAETTIGQERRLLDFESVRDQLKAQIKSLTNALSVLQQDKSGLGERNTT